MAVRPRANRVRVEETPVNYTPTVTGVDDPIGDGKGLDEHLRGIDVALATAGGAGSLGPVVASVLVVTGPAAGYAPEQWTYADGTTKDFVYLVDGFSIDTVTVTRPSDSPITYTAVYAGNGIRTHWVAL